MSDIEADISLLTTSGWKATPSDYSSLRALSFKIDGSGTLIYGYGQSVYAIIKCRWAVPRPGVLNLTYEESPPYQHFRGFVPDDTNRVKELSYRLIEGEIKGIVSVVARPYKCLWTLELSSSPYPEGLNFPYGVPQVFHGHYLKTQDPNVSPEAAPD